VEGIKASQARVPLAAAANEGEVIVRRTLPNNLGVLHVAASQPLSKGTPGNGGLRLWQYATLADAEVEAARLGKGMEVKHSTFHTGFAGAKVVCAANKPPAEWSAAEKSMLLDEAALMLKGMDGTMYTGCDMNTTTGDMDYLDGKCDYVLAAIANPECCPNTATAHGVFGAVEACLGGDVAGKRLLVHGCGGVGSVVAKLLVEYGAAQVQTVDVDHGRADIAGCVNVSSAEAWWTHKVDCVVPCSSSGLFTEEKQKELVAGVVVGATNLPFATKEAQRAAELSLTFVPEGVSSAGAVIVDSVEHYARAQFAAAAPSELYEFTRQTVREKTQEVLALSRRLAVPPSLVLPLAAEAADHSPPIGSRFVRFVEGREEKQLLAGAAAATKQAAEAMAQADVLRAAMAARPAPSHSFVPTPEQQSM